MTEDRTEDRTDDRREAWNRQYATDDYIWRIGPNQFVAAHLADLPPGTAIDLGAGEGRNAVWLASRGWTVTAVDLSPVGLEKAERLAGDNGVAIETVEADAVTWQPARPVDLVVLSYLQIPTEERLTALRHAASWLRPGGTLFVIAHDRSNIGGGHGGPSDPDVCYTVDETVGALAGLRIDVAEVAERVVTIDEDGRQATRVALDTLVRATRPVG
jgi:SAM-dependent methyltransferase